ncbi:ketopantoate reductase family protein [Martelella alba]|uniref:2-dehydropantoate 2-reductase n=1 Tax=Martelella alba TaxID=2590451 RepID=A0ABY2SG56_9HYPH|nr:ketopantoate reductase family protein [Martelella alba]TKI03358.1 ketopantoate reductase family protein [Martelella alba]
MRILVVGAGATGGYFGACLARAGRDVTFLVRERRKSQLARTGLRVQSPLGDFTLAPTLTQAGALDGQYDLILLTVKSFGLDQALTDIAPAVGEQTLILPILNGMRHIDILVQRYGERRVMGGLCKIHATLGPDGEIIQMSRLHQISYGALDGRNLAVHHQVDEQFADSGVEHVLTETIIDDLWEKWLLLGTLGAVTCLARGDTGQVLSADGGAALLEGMFNEALAIMRACGYRQRAERVQSIYSVLSNPATPMTSSMYRDLTQGFPIEARQIIGDLAQRAAQRQIPAPLLNAVNVNLQVYQQTR